jgi:NADPH:quinone reductase-like Zn-dependent oxidoreductase
VYSTVYTALINYGKLPFHPCPSEVGKRSVLILGGSSGTGSVGIQLAKKMGLKVVTTCSTKSVALVENLGADEVSGILQSYPSFLLRLAPGPSQARIWMAEVRTVLLNATR